MDEGIYPGAGDQTQSASGSVAAEEASTPCNPALILPRLLVDGEVNDDTVWCYPIRSSSPWSPIHYAMEDDHVQISSPAVPVIWLLRRATS